MRARWLLLAVVWTAPWFVEAQSGTSQPFIELVREVTYNELHDHQSHGCWRYWIRQRVQQKNTLSEQIETADGPLKRVLANGDHPLAPEEREREEERLRRLVNSPDEQARMRRDYAEDEQRIGRILALLPEAFVYADGGEESGRRHLLFHPRPGYPAHSIEERIFHAMTGELWIDLRSKRLTRLDGQLQENVDFGYGILGRLYKGGWFRMQRTQVSATDWKTDRLELHMTGRALLLKTIARETSEERGGFLPVPSGLTIAQGMKLLSPWPTGATVSTASLPAGR